MLTLIFHEKYILYVINSENILWKLLHKLRHHIHMCYYYNICTLIYAYILISCSKLILCLLILGFISLLYYKKICTRVIIKYSAMLVII